MEINGSDGIPLAGREAEYATDLWLDGPSAFWLHPEGPLSETTPDEWREKQAEAARQRREAQLQNPYANVYDQMAAMGILHGLGSQLYRQQMLANHLASPNYRQSTGLGQILGLCI